MIGTTQEFGSYKLTPATTYFKHDLEDAPTTIQFEQCLLGNQWTSCELLSTRRYNHDSTVFRFKLPATESLNLKPGAYLLIKAPNREHNGGDAIRPYTTISFDNPIAYFDILVKRYDEWGDPNDWKTAHSYRPKGVVSNYIHELKIGETAEFKHTASCATKVSHGILGIPFYLGSLKEGQYNSREKEKKYSVSPLIDKKSISSYQIKGNSYNDTESSTMNISPSSNTNSTTTMATSSTSNSNDYNFNAPESVFFSMNSGTSNTNNDDADYSSENITALTRAAMDMQLDTGDEETKEPPFNTTDDNSTEKGPSSPSPRPPNQRVPPSYSSPRRRTSSSGSGKSMSPFASRSNSVSNKNDAILDIEPPVPLEDALVDSITLIAVGVGAAPYISILYHGLVQSTKCKFVFLYGVRTYEDILMREQLEEWALQYPDRLKIVYCVGSRYANIQFAANKVDEYEAPSIPQDEKAAKGVTICSKVIGSGESIIKEMGWVSQKHIEDYAFAPSENHIVCVCGLPAVYEKICGSRFESELAPNSALAKLGYKAKHVIKM
jgi:ferredoxin-NADP reductase